MSDNRMSAAASIMANALLNAAISSMGQYRSPRGQIEQLAFFAVQGVRVRLKPVEPNGDGKVFYLSPKEMTPNQAAKENLARFLQGGSQLIG